MFSCTQAKLIFSFGGSQVYNQGGAEGRSPLKKFCPLEKCVEHSLKLLDRPVTRGGDSPPRKFFSPRGKICWIYFETIGHSLKNLVPSQKTLRPA